MWSCHTIVGTTKKHAYCKWHNSYSHATNDCNIFHRQVQSAINEGRLKFAESPQMKLDKDPFPTNINMFELNQGQGCLHRGRAVTEDNQAKKSKRWPLAEE
jgi:hypothetical protein